VKKTKLFFFFNNVDTYIRKKLGYFVYKALQLRNLNTNRQVYNIARQPIKRTYLIRKSGQPIHRIGALKDVNVPEYIYHASKNNIRNDHEPGKQCTKRRYKRDNLFKKQIGAL